MAVRLTGNFYTSAGVATCGAAVAIFPASTAATQSTSVCSATATTTTNSTGVWDELTLAANTYDVRITSGSSIRWRRYNEEVQHTTFQTGDDGNFYLGNGVDVGHRWSTGDASNHAYVIGIGDTSQQMHITDLGAIATDWARSAGTHPELAIHSNTTPITDYMAIGNHDGTTGNIDVVGGTTLALKIAGNTEASITAAGLVLPACSDLSFTGSTGTNDIVLTNGLADALSITDGSADVVVVDTSTAGNVITMTSAVTVSNGLTSTAAANTLGATSFNDADVTNVGDIALDSISADNNVINIAVTDNQATALTIKQGSDAYLIIDTANSSESVSIGTGISGTAITLGHGTSEVTVADNLTVAGDMTVNGTTTTVNSTTLTVDDPIITLGGDTAPGSDDNKDRGVEFRYHDGSSARVGFFGYDDSASVFTGLTAACNTSEVFSGTVMNAVFGNIEGTALTVDDVAVDGKVVTMTGSACDTIVMTAAANGAFSLVTTDTAAAAANIQITADGTVDIDSAGVLTLDSGAAINIEPASGSAILLDGTISIDAGVVTGATSITSTAFVGTLSTASQGNITTVGALCGGSIGTSFGNIDNGSSTITTTGLISGGSLDIDNVLIDGTTIGHTCDTDLMTVGNASLTIKGDVTVGVDDTGHDVKFFGAAAGAFMLYDQSCNLLEVRGATAAGPGLLKLSTGEATVVACDVLGKIEFQAPAECGTDAIVAGANIQAVAQATFTASVNNTDLLFMTGLSGAATEKFRFTANGELGVGGANYGTDGQVLTSTGAGTAPAWETAAAGVGLGLVIALS